MEEISKWNVCHVRFWYRYGAVYRRIRTSYRLTSEGYARLARLFAYGSQLAQGEISEKDLK